MDQHTIFQWNVPWFLYEIGFSIDIMFYATFKLHVLKPLVLKPLVQRTYVFNPYLWIVDKKYTNREYGGASFVNKKSTYFF